MGSLADSVSSAYFCRSHRSGFAHECVVPGWLESLQGCHRHSPGLPRHGYGPWELEEDTKGSDTHSPAPGSLGHHLTGGGIGFGQLT